MNKSHPKKLRETAPRVALLLESSHETSRGMIRGIFNYIHHHGEWQVELVYGGPNDLYLPDLEIWKGNGCIGRVRNEKTEKILLHSKIPTVLIDPAEKYLLPEHPLSAFSSVSCDSHAVGQAAAEYLMKLGLENYAYVGDVQNSIWSVLREEAFVETLADSHFKCHVYSRPPFSLHRCEAEEARLVRWLRRLPLPISIFAVNDQRAMQIMQTCRIAGIRIPYDAFVLGVNNDELICRMSQPELSSIALDTEYAGYEAARILNDQMLGLSNEREIVTFGYTDIVTRGSTRSLSLKNEKVIKAVEFIRINAGLNVSVTDVARHIKLSRQWAERIFRAERGCSIYDEIQKVRMRTVLNMVTETTLPFGEIGLRCGFVDGNHLGILFKKNFGMTLREYREKHQKNNGSPE